MGIRLRFADSVCGARSEGDGQTLYAPAFARTSAVNLTHS
jgi:hypothetical protein